MDHGEPVSECEDFQVQRGTRPEQEAKGATLLTPATLPPLREAQPEDPEERMIAVELLFGHPWKNATSKRYKKLPHQYTLRRQWVNGEEFARGGRSARGHRDAARRAFGSVWRQAEGFAHKTVNFEFAIATANRLKPSFVVITGDLINKGGDGVQAADPEPARNPEPRLGRFQPSNTGSFSASALKGVIRRPTVNPDGSLGCTSIPSALSEYRTSGYAESFVLIL